MSNWNGLFSFGGEEGGSKKGCGAGFTLEKSQSILPCSGPLTVGPLDSPGARAGDTSAQELRTQAVFSLIPG